MNLHRPVSLRLFVGAVLAPGVLTLLTLPAPPASAEDPPARRAATNLPRAADLPRDQQIAELEQQIRELTKKLNELRQGPANGQAKQGEGIPAGWIKSLTWRSIGPASMGGRITALAVYEADPTTYWVATASGGLLKTRNNGVTFEHQFDHERTVSLGDVCVAPSDRNIVWVGSGENNPRNSVSYGDGVYQSTDGGKTWKHRGLEKTFQIGKVLIHPRDPNIVYVGALGRLYGRNEERGLYKTTDGGRTWNKIYYIDDKTGVIDMRMDPKDPETLLVAFWERQRDEFDSHPGTEMPPAEGYDRYDPVKKWGPGSGIYKTTDGGKTFHKLTKGLPTSNLGRIGLDIYRKDPKVVFAIIDCEKIGMGLPPVAVYLGVQGESAPGGAKLTRVSPDSPAARAGLQAGDVVKAVDKKDVKDYEGLVQQIQSHKAGDKLTFTVLRGKETREVQATLANRPEAGPAGGGRRGGGRGGAGGGGRGPLGGGLGLRGEDTPAGIRVLEVVPNSPASGAGLQQGDVIETVDKAKITTVRDLAGFLRQRNPGDKVTVHVLRGKEGKDLVLTVAPRTGPGAPGRPGSSTRPYSSGLGGQRENEQNRQGPGGFEYGGVYQSTDGGETWARVNSLNPRPMYFSQIRVDPSDDKYVYVCGIQLYRSSDGGKTFRPNGGNGVHPDQHALWIDPRDGRHMLVGCDGGFYATYDRMDHWDYLNNVAIGQFYHVALDTRRPCRAYGGLQDNGSWGGPTHTLDGRGPVNADWVMVGGGDGFVCRVDPQDPDEVYTEGQDGNMARRNLRTGQFAFLRPRDPPGKPPYRFNWNTPFILSHHNAHIFYAAGNYVFRSITRGSDAQVISPEITRTKRGSGSALAESPRNPNLLYAGSDDGYLWVTRDGGVNWTNVVDRVGLPGPRWVASIEPSRHVEGRVYVAFDAHRSDDDEPYLYVSEDYGQSWKSIRSNLPAGSTRVLREDLVNPDVLYCGTEFGVWVSIDRGKTWARLNNNLPTVAVHELAQHPTTGEMVAATHGRSLWVLDVLPVRQMTAAVVKAPATLYRPAGVVLWHREPARGNPLGSGSRHFIGENPPGGGQIYYSLTRKADDLRLRVLDYTGKTVRELPVKKEPGLHRVAWDLGGGGPRGGRGPGGGGGGRFGQRPAVAVPPVSGSGLLSAIPAWVLTMSRAAAPAPITPGMYRVVLTVDGKEHTQSIRVEPDPTLPATILTAGEGGAGEEEHPLWIDD